jgi:hypothetical protein
VDRTWLQDMIALVVIAAVGLLTAFVTFGVLKSQGTATGTDYSLQGSIVGALVAVGAFTSTYLQIRKSSGTLEELRRVNKELHRKLLKGAPCPPGFEQEVSENQDIVFARPGNWTTAEGDVFKFEAPTAEGDVFPARCTLHIVPAKGGILSGSALYTNIKEKMRKEAEIWGNPPPQFEMVPVGGGDGPDDKGTESLKAVTSDYYQLQLTIDWFRNTPWRDVHQISKAEHEALQKRTESGKPVGARGKRDPMADLEAKGWKQIPLILRTVRVFCYHPGLNKIFFFQFMDQPSDSEESSAGFNNLLGTVRFLPPVE